MTSWRPTSRDGIRMLESLRVVYDRQRSSVVGDPCAVAASEHGLHRLTDIFLDCIVENVQDRRRSGDHDGAAARARVLRREDPERWQRLVAAGAEGEAIVRLDTGLVEPLSCRRHYKLADICHSVAMKRTGFARKAAM